MLVTIATFNIGTVFTYFTYVFFVCSLLVGPGVRKRIRPVKNRVMRCCCGYLSGARCRLYAYGPADATAIQNPVISYPI